jgi:hypothetical protein
MYQCADCTVNTSQKRLLVHGTGRTLMEEKTMKPEIRIKTEVTKEIYGNVLLSFLMGIASIAVIWYLSSVLIALAKHYG